MAAPTQVLPRVDNIEIPPAAGSGFAPDGVTDIVCIAGPAARGPFIPTLIGAGDLAGLQTAYGTGPAVKVALYASSRVSLPYYFLRLPTATVAGVLGPIVATLNPSSTIAGQSALSGTPTDGADVLVTFTLGGTTGTGPITYTLTVGGVVGAPVSLGTGLTIAVLGVTLTLTTAKTITTGDTLGWLQTVASSTVFPTTFAGTGSSVITVTGTPLDAYEVAFKVITGGTITSSPPLITYQLSLDYGAPSPTWTPVTSLSTATTLLLLDGPVSTESTGLTLNFAAGTLVAGDLFVFNTSAPQYDGAGATSGLAALRKGGAATWVRLVGAVTESVATTVEAIIAAYGTTSQPMWGIVDSRDRATRETLAAWSARIAAEWLPYQSTYVGYSQGMARCACPINGRNNRRAAQDVGYTPREMALDIFIDAGEFDLGPLGSDVTITDVNGVAVEMDAFADPSGVAQGATCLRTWPGFVGVYPAKAALPGPPNNLQRVPVRRVYNVGEIIVLAFLQSNAVKNFRVAKKGAPKPEVVGNLFLADQAKFNRIGNDALKRGLIDAGLATSAEFVISPTPIALGGDSYKLKSKFKLNAFIYADVLSNTSQLV